VFFRPLLLLTVTFLLFSLAKVISDMWKRETAEVRAHYIQLSKDKAAQHKDMFPMYKFGDFYGMANKGRKVDRKGVALEEGDINK